MTPNTSQDRVLKRADARLIGPVSIVCVLVLAVCPVLMATLWSGSSSSRDSDAGQEVVLAGDDGESLPQVNACAITVYYPDGWIERIVGGNYELIDQQRRLVVRRAGTRDDLDRMSELC